MMAVWLFVSRDSVARNTDAGQGATGRGVNMGLGCSGEGGEN